MAPRSRDPFWSDDVWLVVFFSLMFDSEMLTLGHSPLIDDDFVSWQFIPDAYFPEIILYWELIHFEMTHSHWGIATLPILTLDSTSCLWLLLSMDHRVIDTLGSVFSAYLVWFGYSLTFVTHSCILHCTLLYLHPSYQSLTPFEPTYFIVLHDLIPFSLSEEDTD